MKKPSAAGYTRDPKTGDVKVQIAPTNKLLRRYPRTVPRSVALDTIQAKLAAATMLYRHHRDGGRQGVFRAIADVMNYFESQGIPRATMEPLQAVSAALVNADRGVESPIFRADRTSGGAPGASAATLEFEGKLAVVAECCVRHCKAEGHRPYLQPGLELAARLVNQSALQTTVTVTQLKTWRARMGERASKSLDRRTYDSLISSEEAKRQPLAYAKTLVSHDWVAAPNMPERTKDEE